MLQRFKAWMTLPRRIFLGLLGIPILLILYVTQPLLRDPVPRPGISADPQRLEADVRHLAQASRVWLHPESLDAQAAWIRSRLETLGGSVSEQAFQVRGRTYRNVVGRFGPKPGALIVVGAHYDTCGPLPGADDNASGVAGLLELARLLAQRPPTRPVELVAYTLEEPPFFRTSDMGSARHAQALLASGRPVKAVLVLEMIGTFKDAADSQDYPIPGMGLLYGSRGDYLACVGKVGGGLLMRDIKTAFRRSSPLPLKSINAPAGIRGIDFSDHLNYWSRGLPAVMFTDTSFYRNPNYHQPQDTPERLDYRRMAQVVEGVRGVMDVLEKNENK
ncbi:MAG TPA: M28 family peptidase [Holophagaceae bacterium]|nr:M28 family peptidase [Holophagaceae bacterium]